MPTYAVGLWVGLVGILGLSSLGSAFERSIATGSAPRPPRSDRATANDAVAIASGAQGASLSASARRLLQSFEAHFPEPRLPKGTMAENDVFALGRALDRWQGAGVVVRDLGQQGGYAIRSIDLPATGRERLRVAVVGGLHGNEPNGVAAAVGFVDAVLADPALRRSTHFRVVPAASPENFAKGSRRSLTSSGLVDPNRVFLEPDPPFHVRAVRAELGEFGPDLVVDLHASGSMEEGHGAILRGDPAMPKRAFDRALGEGIPLQRSEVRRKDGSLRYRPLAPGLVESTNGGTLKDFVFEQGARWALTLEGSTKRVGYAERVADQIRILHHLVEAALDGKPN
ncbi:MAG: hypothetical protein KC416_16955 [Myxococcales bacterium]|nr:hypothetical protein [Myxococcales bacterium]